MRNKYQVTRSDSATQVPLGMNALLYIGSSYREAMQVYQQAKPGLDAWNQPKQGYGIVLVFWNESTAQYEVMANRGFDKE